MGYGIGMFLAGLVSGAGIGWYVAFFTESVLGCTLPY